MDITKLCNRIDAIARQLERIAERLTDEAAAREVACESLNLGQLAADIQSDDV